MSDAAREALIKEAEDALRNDLRDCNVGMLVKRLINALSAPGDAEREELARLRLLHAGQKAHEKALQQELTEYGVPEDWPEYQELRAKLIAQGNNCLDEKPSAQNRLQYFFKNRRPVEPVVTERMVEAAYSARIPGGSQAHWWFAPHADQKGQNNIKGVITLMLEAALNVSQPGVK